MLACYSNLNQDNALSTSSSKPVNEYDKKLSLKNSPSLQKATHQLVSSIPGSRGLALQTVYSLPLGPGEGACDVTTSEIACSSLFPASPGIQAEDFLLQRQTRKSKRFHKPLKPDSESSFCADGLWLKTEFRWSSWGSRTCNSYGRGLDVVCHLFNWMRRTCLWLVVLRSGTLIFPTKRTEGREAHLHHVRAPRAFPGPTQRKHLSLRGDSWPS